MGKEDFIMTLSDDDDIRLPEEEEDDEDEIVDTKDIEPKRSFFSDFEGNIYTNLKHALAPPTQPEPPKPKASESDVSALRAQDNNNNNKKKRVRDNESDSEGDDEGDSDSEEDEVDGDDEDDDDSLEGDNSDEEIEDSEDEDDDEGEDEKKPTTKKKEIAIKKITDDDAKDFGEDVIKTISKHDVRAANESKKKKKDAAGDESDSDEENYDKSFFAAPEEAEEEAANSAVSFVDLNLSRPLLKAIDKLGWKKPTPIQAKSIPVLVTGKDLCGSAVTGSGKTGAFLLPVLERLLYRPRRIAATRVLVLLPTRELAVQCHDVCEKLCSFTDIRSAVVVGGMSQKDQEIALKSKPDIVIATPGRLIDHLLNTHSFGLEDIEVLILDEADRLLEIGFTDEIEELVKNTPKSRQTILFSATMTDKVDKLAQLSLKHPVRVSVDSRKETAKGLIQEFIRIRERKESDKEAILVALCKRTFTSKTIIFCNLKATCARVTMLFHCVGLKAAELQGNLSQEQRIVALERFKTQNVDFLICTDVAARGLDVKGIETVINYEMPRDEKTYIHRVGRTARAGNEGRSISFAGEEHRNLMKKIIKHANKKNETVKNRIVPAEAISYWKEKLLELTPQLEDLATQRKIQRELEEADKQAQRALNLVQFKDEIASRPAKVWFQSKKEKDAAKERARQAAGIVPTDKKGGKKAEAAADDADVEDENDNKKVSRKERKAKIKKHQKSKKSQIEQETGIRDMKTYQQIMKRHVKRAERQLKAEGALISRQKGDKKKKQDSKKKPQAKVKFDVEVNASKISFKGKKGGGKKKKPAKKFKRH